MTEPEASYPFPQPAQSLASFGNGQVAVITGFLGGRKFQGRLLALGLFPGQRLTVCQNNGNSLVVSINGNRLALGRGVSQKILAAPTPLRCPKYDECTCPGKEPNKIL
jgi:ferrous iron transport protein A